MSDPPADTSQASGRSRIIWDDSNSRNVYANAAHVTSTREEISFLLDVGVQHLSVFARLDMSATRNTQGRAGFVFDRYSTGGLQVRGERGG